MATKHGIYLPNDKEKQLKKDKIKTILNPKVAFGYFVLTLLFFVFRPFKNDIRITMIFPKVAERRALRLIYTFNEDNEHQYQQLKDSGIDVLGYEDLGSYQNSEINEYGNVYDKYDIIVKEGEMNHHSDSYRMGICYYTSHMIKVRNKRIAKTFTKERKNTEEDMINKKIDQAYTDHII